MILTCFYIARLYTSRTVQNKSSHRPLDSESVRVGGEYINISGSLPLEENIGDLKLEQLTYA